MPSAFNGSNQKMECIFIANIKTGYHTFKYNGYPQSFPRSLRICTALRAAGFPKQFFLKQSNKNLPGVQNAESETYNL